MKGPALSATDYRAGTTIDPQLAEKCSGDVRLHVLQTHSIRMIGVERIEGIAARHEAESWCRGAVAEGAAERLSPKRRAGEHGRRQIGIREGHAAEADEIGQAATHVVLGDVRQPLLKIRVRRSDEDKIWKRGLELSR